MAVQQMSDKSIQVVLFVMVVVLVGVVIWEEARFGKAIEFSQAFIESVPEQLKTLGSEPVTTL